MRFFKAATLLAGLAAVGFGSSRWQPTIVASEPVAAQGHPSDSGGLYQGSPPSAATSQGVMLNSRTFNIPFQIEAAGTQPVQVDLYVSRGDGQPWERLDRQPPTIREFQFAAPEDGVYWFATRTLDAVGRPHPPGPIAPQLKVVVDTTSPVIQLTAEVDDRGRIEVRMSIDDATPVRGLQLQYATDATRHWYPLDPAPLRQGETFIFTPADPWQRVYLHLVATDAAGNQGVASKRVERPRIANLPANTLAGAEPGRVPPSSYSATLNAGYRTSPPIVSAPITSTADRSVPTRIAGNSSPPVGVAGWPGTARGASAPSFSVPNDQLPPPATWQQISEGNHSQEGIRLTGPGQIEAGEEQTPVVPPRPQSAAEALRPLQTDLQLDDRQRDPSPKPRDQSGSQSNMNPLPATSSPRSDVDSIPLPIDASEGRYRSGRSDADAASGPEADLADGGNLRTTIDLAELERQLPVRFSDSVRFSLEYELEAVGSRGIETVELWGTVDAGQTWKRWGTDPDLTSPFDIETLGEGIFGYRSVVVGRNGLVSPSPRSGDLPDILVVVDTTRPEVRLTSVRYGEGDQIGSLVIRYECRDEHLTPRPITLSFSDGPQGPWTTIAAGLRNEGEYVWPADPELPRKFYLRIDAVDRADNVGSYILDRPIDAQGLAPRATIRGFRPVTGGVLFDEAGTTANRESASRR